jgi:hypothetical protein
MEDKRLYPFRVAALALAMEWDEWIRVAESDARSAKINADPAMPGGAGAHVTRSFSAGYAVPGAGWFLFDNYLQGQLAGHTILYDPLAANADWKGIKVLNKVKASSRPTLEITQKQVQDWTSGRTKNIKAAGNNPFKADAIAKEASRGA